MTQPVIDRTEQVQVIREQVENTHLQVLQLVVQASLHQWGAYCPQHGWSIHATYQLVEWNILQKHEKGYILTDFGKDFVVALFTELEAA
jgi:hypothetical protein